MMTAALGQRRKGRGGGSPDFGTEVQYLMLNTRQASQLWLRCGKIMRQKVANYQDS
jgi:hypothetical protein